MSDKEPARLLHVGPSQASTLLACSYRVALDHESRAFVGRVHAHPKALLGSIGHSVCEQASRDALGPSDETWDERFDYAWNAAVAKAEADAGLGPASGWPGYYLQKALWSNRAREATERAILHPWLDQVDELGRRVSGPELPLQAFDGRMIGTADLVVRDGNHVEIRDLKSGNVRSSDGSIEPSYEIQLLLYGVMYEEMFGIWPERLVIDPVSTASIDVPADRVRAGKVAIQVLSALESYNEALEAGRIESLAAPSSGTCQYCDHTLECSPFWRKVNPAWRGQPRALKGKAVAIKPGTVTIDVVSGSVDPGSWLIGGLITRAEVGQVLTVTAFEVRGERRAALVVGSQIVIAAQ